MREVLRLPCDLLRLQDYADEDDDSDDEDEKKVWFLCLVCVGVAETCMLCGVG